MSHETSKSPHRILARGRTSEILDVGGGRVLKLLHAGWAESTARREYENARLLQDAGVPCPATFGLQDLSGRNGILFERVDGPSMLNVLAASPWKVHGSGQLLAEIHAGIHSRQVHGLVEVTERLRSDIAGARLDDDLRKSALRLLESLPGGRSVCHGDFHPGNVVLTGRGPLVIDWADAASGDPLADVARTIVLIRFGGNAVPGLSRRILVRMLGSFFLRSYRRRYFSLMGSDGLLLQRWIVVSCAARLAAAIPGERAALTHFLSRSLRSQN